MLLGRQKVWVPKPYICNTLYWNLGRKDCGRVYDQRAVVHRASVVDWFEQVWKC